MSDDPSEGGPHVGSAPDDALADRAAGYVLDPWRKVRSSAFGKRIAGMYPSVPPGLGPAGDDAGRPGAGGGHAPGRYEVRSWTGRHLGLRILQRRGFARCLSRDGCGQVVPGGGRHRGGSENGHHRGRLGVLG